MRDDRRRKHRKLSDVPCRYCGGGRTGKGASELREHYATYQVIVACSSCGAAFTALSRN